MAPTMRRKVCNAIKLEYINLMESENITAYRAVRLLLHKYPNIADASQVRKWYKKKDKIKISKKSGARIDGGGRKPRLGLLEDIIFDEILNLRLNNAQVKRSWIRARGEALARENRLMNFKASCCWVDKFMQRNNLSLRRTTNLTKLSESDIL